MAAEMVIRLVDGSSDTSASLSPANQLPTAHNPDVPTVASSRAERSSQTLATAETDPRKSTSQSTPSINGNSEVRTSDAIIVDSMEEFTRRLEQAIQELGKRSQPSEKRPNEQSTTKAISTTQQVLDAIEQRLSGRTQFAFKRMRRAKVWQNPTVRNAINRAKNATKSIARRVGKSRIARRLMASRIGRSLKARGSALFSRLATGARGATAVAGTGAVAASGGTAAGAAAGTGAGGAAAAGGTAAVAGVAAVAIPVAATVAAFVALVGATYALHRTFKSTADDLEGFSGQISAARARAQANTTINMAERARAVGPQLGRLENANTRFQDSTEKLWTAILQVLLKFEPAITKVVDGLTVGVDYGAKIIAQLEVVKAAITVLDKSDDKAAAQSLADATKRLNDSMAVFLGGLPPTNNNLFDDQLKAFLQQNLPNNKWQNPPPVGGGMP